MGQALEGVVVVVLHADAEAGRETAIAAAARGARVVVAGALERALGEVVGEIAYAGGQARHAVGGAAEAQAKAVATWGRVDFIVGAAGEGGGDSPEGTARAIVDGLIDAVSRQST